MCFLAHLRAGFPIWASIKASRSLIRNGNSSLFCSLAEPTTYVALLKRCGKSKSLPDGRRVHAQMSELGYDRDTFLGNSLIEMYGNCGSLEDARALFDKLLNPNSYSCNILIKAYGQNGSLDDASSVFRRMPSRNAVSWNAMITVLAQNGRAKEALELFHQMHLEGVMPNKITFVSSLNACASLGAQEQGKEIHVAIVGMGHELDVVVGTALVNMYGKCKSPCNARSVFSRMPHRDLVSWTAMIAAFSQSGHGKEALDLFRQMQLEDIRPNKITFVCALDACGYLAAIEEGRALHKAIADMGYEGDVVVGNALIDMYGKCGSICEARSVFHKMRKRDVVSWTAMIAASAQRGNGKEALALFHQMQLRGMDLDMITLISALDACALLAALKEGQEIHSSIVDRGYEQNVMVANALLNMYGKCGNIFNARNLFGRMPHPDVISWTAMMAAYAQSGHDNEALDLFYQMQLEGVKPDKVTFTCILIACSRSGRVDHGRDFFVSMYPEYGISHSEDHYICMIDLLCRAGHLDEAEGLINHLPSEVPLAWLCMLGACRFHGDVDRGVRAASHCMQVDPTNAAHFVMMSNVYASAGRWDDVAKVRLAMMSSGVKLPLVRTCLEMDKVIPDYAVGDEGNSGMKEIHGEELQELMLQMEDTGYIGFQDFCDMKRW